MNRKAGLVFILVIAILTALAVFDSFRNPLLTFHTPNSDPNLPSADQTMNFAVKSAMDFMAGADEYVHMVAPNDACVRIKGVNQIFCLQGYYFAVNADRLQKVKQTENLKLDEQLPTQAQNTSIVRNIWYSALGMAVSQAELAPLEFAKYIDQKFLLHYLQGWSYFNFSFKGALETAHFCDVEVEGLNRLACWFGVGQAAYFNRDQLATMNYHASEIADGFLFTQALIEPPKPDSAPAKMSKVAQVLTDMWLGKDSGSSELADCLDRRHAVECSKYF